MNTTIKERYNVNLSNPYTNQRFYDSVYHPSHMFVMTLEFVEFVEFVVRPARSKPRAAERSEVEIKTAPRWVWGKRRVILSQAFLGEWGSSWSLYIYCICMRTCMYIIYIYKIYTTIDMFGRLLSDLFCKIFWYCTCCSFFQFPGAKSPIPLRRGKTYRFRISFSN